MLTASKQCWAILFALCLSLSYGQELSGPELLQKAIAFHDPEGQWDSFQGKLEVIMRSPNATDRISRITIDLPEKVFHLEISKDNDRYSYHFEKDTCSTSLNGKTQLTEEQIQQFRLTCERAKMMKNYYTYLYGLPMKLKDPGTRVDPKLQKRAFKGKDYLVLKVNYDPEVGNDTWYFYFDPETYAMEVYQFFHDETKNDGEYILLKDLEEINGIKMPKIREWYYNNNDTYLATDILQPWGS